LKLAVPEQKYDDLASFFNDMTVNGNKSALTKKKKIEHLIYGDHNYGARRAPRPPEGNHWHPEG